VLQQPPGETPDGKADRLHLTLGDEQRAQGAFCDDQDRGAAREFAAVLSRNVREVDVVARTGGGRFTILSPETEQDGGALIRRLDQLLQSLEVVRTLPDASEVKLLGRQVTYPDEVPTGGELLAMIRSELSGS